MALDRGTYVLTRPRSDGRVRIESVNREPALTAEIEKVQFVKGNGWANYPLGVVTGFGASARGLDMLFAGNLPIGAGLSSSASILVATATAVNSYLDSPLTTAKVVSLCHRAEVGFVGVQCGIMDPYASAFGKADHVMHLDCRSHAHADVPLDSSRASIVVCDTTRRRELSDGRFNDRVRECAAAVERLRSLGVQLRALRDVEAETLTRVEGELEPVLARRCRHVVSEIARTRRGAEALTRGDLAAFGGYLRESHESCRREYEVSSSELDALVSAANRHEASYGARLTGAGFGGCAVAVVRNEGVEDFRERVAAEYEAETGLRARIHVFRPSPGARRIGLDELPA
jgi:galactokinase